jgi:predicted extracellular nuclease
MNVDLVAVQEISDTAAFNDLVAGLHERAGVFSGDTYSGGTYQKTGFIYRTGQMTLVATQSLFSNDSYAFPRPPLRADFDLVRSDGSHEAFTAIVVHLKANSGAVDPDSADRRRAAVSALKTYVDDLSAHDASARVAIVGDYNDTPSAPAADNVFAVLSNDAAHYDVLTQALADDGQYSYISYPHLFDNIVTTASLRADYHGDTRVIALDQQVEYNYEEYVSDHRPVVSLFDR